MYSKPIAARSVSTFLDAVLRQRVLVTRLAGGEHEKVVALLVLDQGLVQVGFAVDDIDQVVHHAALATHDQVEVAQADVEVDDGGLVPAQGQAGGEAGAGGGLAHPALAGRHHDDLGHERRFPCEWVRSATYFARTRESG
jgi:hypothetical protein